MKPQATPAPTVSPPPCASWRLWKGKEVEGTNGVGVATLFIRSLVDFPNLKPEDDLSLFRTSSGCERVWFCKEFTDWPMLRAIGKHFDQVCLEVEPKCFDSVPKDLRKSAVIYLKVTVPLKPTDFVCVGPNFSDEAFELGKGAKVTPDDYIRDVRIR